MPFFYQPNCDTLDSLTSFASIHINILPVYMYFWLDQWYAIRNKYHILLFETLLNEWDWYFCNPTLHGLAAYTCGYGDEIQTGALVTIFLVVNGVVYEYEHVSSPIVLIAECLWSLKSAYQSAVKFNVIWLRCNFLSGFFIVKFNFLHK